MFNDNSNFKDTIALNSFTMIQVEFLFVLLLSTRVSGNLHVDYINPELNLLSYSKLTNNYFHTVKCTLLSRVESEDTLSHPEVSKV